MNGAGHVAAIDGGKPIDLDEAILTLWRSRLFDTAEIAKTIKKPESFVANRLGVLRDAGRR